MTTHCTFTEAAARLGVSRRTVSRLASRGDLDIIGIGSGRRVSVASVEEMLRPQGASRNVARICTAEEVAELRAWWEQQLAEARAGMAGGASARD